MIALLLTAAVMIGLGANALRIAVLERRRGLFNCHYATGAVGVAAAVLIGLGCWIGTETIITADDVPPAAFVP